MVDSCYKGSAWLEVLANLPELVVNYSYMILNFARRLRSLLLRLVTKLLSIITRNSYCCGMQKASYLVVRQTCKGGEPVTRLELNCSWLSCNA